MSDVAKLAEVSVMTVSRVLNENPNVLEETRRRVFAAVEELGYERNEIARSLRERRTRQIGILVPNLYDPFFALCAHTINAVAKLHEYSVSTATTDQDPAMEFQEASRMLRRSVDGLIVVPAGTESSSKLLRPEFGRMPIVTMDRPASGSGRQFDTLMVENKRGAQRGTEHLLALGHKRIVLFTLDPVLYTLQKRMEGYGEAMKAAGNRAEVVVIPETMEGTLERLRKVIQRSKPTALFCSNNVATRLVMHGLRSMELQPPNPVAVTGFDDFESADLIGSGVTVVRQPVETMARLAAEMLMARLANGDGGAPRKRIVLPVELVVRGSCGTRV